MLRILVKNDDGIGCARNKHISSHTWAEVYVVAPDKQRS